VFSLVDKDTNKITLRKTLSTYSRN